MRTVQTEQKISFHPLKAYTNMLILSVLISLGMMTLNVPPSYAQTTAPQAKQFPPPPPPYVHPRVFTSAAELPQIKQNLTSDGYGAHYGPMLRNWVNGQVASNAYLRRYADLNITVDTVTDEHITDYWYLYSEMSGQQLGVMALWGVLFVEGDEYYVADAKMTAIRAAMNHSIVAKHVRDRYVNNNFSGLSSDAESKIKDHWGNPVYSTHHPRLKQIWRNGSAGLALAYDLLYNDMTPEQQAYVRGGLVVATADWKLLGGDDDNPIGNDGNAISNWYGYQGDYMVQMAAIYGEEGFSQTAWDEGVKMLLNYLRVAFYPSGYSVEDSYGPNLGLREGGRGLIALARQGVNEFENRPEAMYNIGSYAAHDIEAVPNAALIGGESGGNYAFRPESPSGENPASMYPSSMIIWKHVYPNDPTIDHLYRWRLGEQYNRDVRWQGLIDYAFFGQDYLPTHNPSLDLTKFYPERGKLIARNNLTDQAIQFAFDARPDGSAIGHDKAGRGYFSLNGLGRRWVSHIDFRYTRYSTESSTMHIDGKGQAYKTPSVQIASPAVDDGLVVSMAADLEYAYDWQWNEPWTWSATHTPRPSASDWQQESVNPRDFYTVAPAPSWMSNTLWDDRNQGLFGMWMWRRPNIPVEKAYRSVAYVRSAAPFVIIADEIKQDNSVRRYESYMQLPFDLDQMSVNGNDAILWANGDDRRLLVRVLYVNAANNSPVSFQNEAFQTSIATMDARRLIIGADAVDPQFTVMLWPHYAGDSLPQTSWNGDRTQVMVGDVTLNVDRSNGYPLFSSDLQVGDVNCDNTVNVLDALFIMQYEVRTRTDNGACPVAEADMNLLLQAGDVNDDANVDVIDALYIMQCEAQISNSFCP